MGNLQWPHRPWPWAMVLVHGIRIEISFELFFWSLERWILARYSYRRKEADLMFVALRPPAYEEEKGSAKGKEQGMTTVLFWSVAQVRSVRKHGVTIQIHYIFPKMTVAEGNHAQQGCNAEWKSITVATAMTRGFRNETSLQGVSLGYRMHSCHSCLMIFESKLGKLGGTLQRSGKKSMQVPLWDG